MLGALAIDVRAGQTNIAQHAVVELQEQVSAPRPFPPTPKPAQQVRQQPTWSGGAADIAQLEETLCIDTISMYHRSVLVISARRNQIDSE
jgi:hypothetical protein